MPPKDVLIYADESTIEHKLAENCSPEEQCYWTVHGTPRQTLPGMRVLFTDGDEVIAIGRITGVGDGALWFDPLERASEPLPAEPVTRGYKYVESPEVPEQ